MEAVLQTLSLSKRYRKHLALDNCTLTVNRGDIYGFVGNNGAGKTTLMKVVMGLSRASEGSFSLFGIPSTRIDGAARRRVSAIIESPAFYPHMSGFENLRLHALVLGRKVSQTEVVGALEAVGLAGERTRKVRGYSMGMRQRLGIARVLISKAEFAILDEPSNGLDPSGMADLRELVLRLNMERGVTFLISTHHTLELDGLVNRMGIINQGRIVEECDFHRLKRDLDARGVSIERYCIERASRG